MNRNLMRARMPRALRWGACLACAVVLLLPGWGFAAEKKPDPAELKAKLQREQDPAKRAELRIRLADLRLDDAKQLYDSAADDKGLETLKEMQAMVEQSEQELFGTGRDPRKKPKGFKEGEIKLRQMQRRLQDLRMQVPADERPAIEEIIKRLGEIQEEFLYGIMRVKDTQATTQPQVAKEPKQ